MKRLLVLCVILLSALTLPLYAQPWNTNGVLTNPTANTILADSGPMTPGSHLFGAFVASSAQAVVFVEWRDTDNVTVIKSQALIVGAFSNTQFTPTTQFNEIADGNHLVLRLSGTILGQIQGSVFIQ